MRKKLPIIIIAAIILLVPLALIAVFSAKLIDKTDCQGVAYGDTLSFSDRKNEMFFDALEDVSTASRLDFSMDERDINLLLNALLREKLTGSKGVTLTVTGEGTATAKLSVPVLGSNTVVYADVKGKAEKGSLILSFENVKIGGFSQAFSKKVLSLFRGTVKKATASLGDGFSFDDMTYTLSADLLTSAIKSDGENGTLYALLLDRIDRENSTSMFWCKNGRSGAVVELAELKYDEARDGAIPFDVKLSEVKAKCETLVTADAIPKSDVDLVFRYLVQGYGKLEDAEKEKVNGIGFTSVGISSPAEYNGTTGEELGMGAIIGSQLAGATIGLSGLSVKIDETAFNNIFIKQKAVGKGTTFCRQNGSSVSYLTVEALYCDIVDDSFIIKVVINANGFRMLIETEFSCQTRNDVRAVLTLTDARIGSYACTTAEKTGLVEYLSAVFAEIDWISVDADSFSVTFDFSSFINSDTLTTIIQFAFNTYLSAKGGALADIGYLELLIRLGLF